MTEHLRVPFLWLSPGSSSNYWFYDGVPLFFILSGFLVYRSYERCVAQGRSVAQYILNRYLRIAPGVYAYVVLATILLLSLGVLAISNLTDHRFWTWAFLNFIFVPKDLSLTDGFGTGHLNGSLWTIPAEFGFYLAIPVLYAIASRLGFTALLLALTVIAAFGIILRSSLDGVENSRHYTPL